MAEGEVSGMSTEAVTKVSRLDGGLRIATVEMPWMQSVCLGLWCTMGSRHEPARIHGVSHFLEHMVFKGTRRRSARRIVAEVEGMGGCLNAFTAEDHTCYHAKVLSDRLPALADVLTDMYLHPRLSPRDVVLERDVIVEEIRGCRDNAATRVEELLDSALWPGHALGRPVTGTESSLARITGGHLRALLARGHTAANTVVAVAGRARHDEVVPLFEKLLADLPRGRKASPGRPPGPAASAPLVEHADVEQCHVEIGFRTPGRRHPDRFALRLLSILLAENMSSRLFQSLRERLALCYHVQSELSLVADTGALILHLALDPGNLPKALGVIRAELDRLAAKGCSPRELAAARSYALGQLAMSLEKNTGRMFLAAESLIGHGRIIDPAESSAAFEAVTPDVLRQVAGRAFLQAEPALAVVCAKGVIDPLGTGRCGRI